MLFAKSSLSLDYHYLVYWINFTYINISAYITIKVLYFMHTCLSLPWSFVNFIFTKQSHSYRILYLIVDTTWYYMHHILSTTIPFIEVFIIKFRDFIECFHNNKLDWIFQNWVTSVSLKNNLCHQIRYKIIIVRFQWHERGQLFVK